MSRTASQLITPRPEDHHAHVRAGAHLWTHAAHQLMMLA